MGPFVPDIISDQLNLVVALVLGVAFGYVLEQAGFSSSRRLAGLFYGYDFTVLRVFFTAAVTAMSGILLLGAFGYVDTTALYVNPTWLWPAVVGGIIMGIGFILGGYCPGTSIAAAAIGKVDAVLFVLGGLVGVLAFGEAFPLFQRFYESSSLGPLRVYESLGISQGLFAFLLIAMAVFAFGVTSWIEQKVSKEAPSRSFNATWHRTAGAAVLGLGLVFLVLPDRQTGLLAKVSDPDYVASHPVTMMEPDELAFHLADKNPRVRVFDLRPERDFKKSAMPGSMNVKLDDLFKRDLLPEFSQRHLKKVFVAETEQEAQNAAEVLRELGYDNVAALGGGYPAFRETIMEVTAPSSDPVVAEFRASARSRILALVKEEKAKGSGTKKPEKKIAGGC